jgi:hypothetical protein
MDVLKEKAVKPGASKPKKRRAKPGALDGVPTLMTHREVAEHFRVTTAGLRKWVARGEFPIPHSIIAKTWYYQEAMIAHRLRTGEWPGGVKFIQ